MISLNIFNKYLDRDFKTSHLYDLALKLLFGGPRWSSSSRFHWWGCFRQRSLHSPPTSPPTMELWWRALHVTLRVTASSSGTWGGNLCVQGRCACTTAIFTMCFQRVASESKIWLQGQVHESLKTVPLQNKTFIETCRARANLFWSVLLSKNAVLAPSFLSLLYEATKRTRSWESDSSGVKLCPHDLGLDTETSIGLSPPSKWGW